MYSIVLATMLTTGTATPDWGCRGCCGGCGGCIGCYGCCGGCWGCWGGCWGGCYGCWGGYGWAGWGYGWGGCYGCCGGCYGCWGGCYGCWGCYGGLAYGVPAVVAPAAVAPAAPVSPPAKKENKKSALLGNAAEVIVQAPINVQLSVEDRNIPRVATEQSFRTPDLEPGSSYTYTFKARVNRNGNEAVYTKQVKVQAGEIVTVDFTKLAAEGKDTARVTVKLPSDARLYVEGVLCPLTTATRSFDTPELDAGQRYYYTLKAEVVRDGQTRTARRRVVVEAGKEITVEFKDLPLRTVSR